MTDEELEAAVELLQGTITKRHRLIIAQPSPLTSRCDHETTFWRNPKLDYRRIQLARVV
jgi:hypothetical protein